MRKISTGNMIWGSVLIVLGSGFLLDQLGIINFGNIIANYWPLIFIIIAIGELVNNKVTSALVFGLIGIILQLSVSDIVNVNIWSLIWPIFLIWIGISVLIRSSARSQIKSDSRDFIGATGIFGGEDKKVDSNSFSGASMNAIFGGTKLDLRHSNLSKNGAVIDALIIFGGGEVIVPKGLPIRLDTFALFGGVDDKRSDIKMIEEDQPYLKIQGTILFGGLEIKD